MKKGLLAVALFMVLALCFSITLLPQGRAIADFGDFSGGSDYGGSDSSWSSSDSSWSSSDSSWSSSDSSWGSSGSSGSSYYYYSDSGSDSGGGFSFFFFGVAVFVVIIAAIVFFMKNKFSSSGSVAPGATRTDASKLTPVSQYTALDPGFDEAALEEKLSNLYVKLQNAWTAKDISPVRPYFTDAYYNQMERQCQRYVENHMTNHVDKIAVLGVSLQGYYQAGNMDHMIAEVRTRIVDYTVDDATGEVRSGSKTAEKFMVYEWDLVRKQGTITGKTDTVTVKNCPNCGAPVNINATARCPYCDTIITVDANDWAIVNIKGISQRTSK